MIFSTKTGGLKFKHSSVSFFMVQIRTSSSQRRNSGIQSLGERRSDTRSLGLSSGSRNSGGEDSVVKGLEERVREHEMELEDVRRHVEDLQATLDARDGQVARLKGEIHEKDACIRDATQQIKVLEARHAETTALGQKRVVEARMSRDEEVSRLEMELEAVRKEHEERQERLEHEYKNGLASLENSIDAIKGMNTQLRQENEVMQSTVKKAEARVRDAERETQRALNRFEAAIKSLEQLEYQYSVLEEDAKETEHVKTQRILALEQELEDLRVSKSHALHEAQRDVATLHQKLEECVESLERSEKCHRKAELAAAESLHREKSMESTLGHVQTLYDKVLSENHTLQDEVAKARGEIERLKGSLDGTSSVSKSMHEMLKTYEKDNASLVDELNVMRGRIRAAEEENQMKLESIETLRKQAIRMEEDAKSNTNTILAEKAMLVKELEVLRGDVQTKEKIWMSEKDSLTREVEILHAKVEVLSQRPVVTHTVQPEVTVASADEEQVEASTSEEAKSISFGDPKEENGGESASPMPDLGFKTPTTSRNNQDLRDQLTALKLSILDSTSRHSGTKKREDSADGGYLRSYMPSEGDQSDTSSLLEDDEEEDEESDALSRARHQVTRAKQYLSRLSAIES